ncbi:hypothetical protein GCM10009133_08670 [Cocleimonas flava]|uniref:Diguanylate cyclase (GGDEF)-like protein n=1 Tax=Cocleimonas flava TaxID=634765 RepID=A0A4R1F438_9GAMM|nr:EAL domain-containing protein [Cocleimonas flava]TCJ87229.1 diguanylate cyclase (GGDEF)-like protein [Cocleimonas flava]
MNLKINKVIIPAIFSLSCIFIAMVFTDKLPHYFSLDADQSKNSIDDILYSDNYELELTDHEKQWLSQHSAIRLGISRHFPPFGSVNSDNEFIGFSADFMRMIEYRLKIKFDMAKDASWGETMEMAKAGQLDMIASIVNTETRRSFLEFTEPYVSNPTVIINDSVAKGYLRTLDNLKGKKIAATKGSFVSNELSRKYPEIEIIDVKNSHDALSMAHSGLVDAYVGNAVAAGYLINKYHFHDLSFSGQTEYSSTYSIGIVKSNMMLVGIIKKVLASISEVDREIISNYWFRMGMQPHIAMNKVVIIGTVLAGLLLLVLAWTYSLRKTQRQLKTSEELLKTSRRLLTREIEVDHLTGLGNRRKFNKLLEQQIEQSKSIDEPFTLIYLDLDNIKQVNISMGHSIGDLLIIEVSKRLKSCLESTNEITRVAGDEFMIILPGVSDKKKISVTTKCINNCLSLPFHINEHEIVTSTSIGITCYPEDATTSTELINNADQTMDFSKNNGSKSITFYDSSMKHNTALKNDTIRDLRLTVKKEQFILLYQPIIDLSKNKICKAEALIRWNHPSRGFISPEEFIPLAEEAGLINEIGEWTFKEAVSQTARVMKILDNEFQMSINTSPLQYHKNGMKIDIWNSYLDSYGLSGKNLVMEITEGILMKPSSTVINNLNQLKNSGIDVAIDDFGTGYSSLSYLKSYDFNFLKIDQSFVRNLTVDSDDMALVKAIIIMAHKLRCKVIAEGIETKEQSDILFGAGCDYGQGFYYSKPLIASDFEDFVTHWDSKNTDRTKSLIPFQKDPNALSSSNISL